MPHFILDCSENVFEKHAEEQILEQVHLVPNATQLFSEDDTRVRVNPFRKYLVGNKRDDFLHVFAYVMEGRSVEQKANLSKKVVQRLTDMFPDISKTAMNICDFENATYFNRDLL